MEFLIVVFLIIFLLLLPRIRSHFRTPTPIPTDKAALAQARVRQLKYFYIHFGFYLLTMIAVLLLTLIVGNEDAALLVAIIWGLAVAIHAFVVFGINGGIMRQWEQRQLNALMDDEESKTRR